MGFAKKVASTPSIPTTREIPVVTETVDNDSAKTQQNAASRRKGLLSTIFTKARRPSEAEGNSTLG